MEDKKVPEDNKVQPEPVQKVKSPKKKKTGHIVFFVFLGIIVLIAIVLAILVFTGTLGKKKTSTEVKQTNTEYRMTGNDLQDFDLSFLKLENKEENKVYSPLSIKYALAMLNEGADGATKEQIANVIGEYKAKKYINSENMSLANALFVRDSFKENLQEDYIKSIKTKYDAEVIFDSFKDASTINNWTSDKTFKLIDGVFSDEDMVELEYVLVNALAIDMKWQNQIHCDYSAQNRVPCYNNGIYSVTYLHEKLEGEDYQYSETSYPYAGDSSYPRINFNGIDKVKTSEVLGSFNKYDIVKTLGEDKIRQEVGDAYRKWLEEQKNSENKWEYENAEKDVDKYLNQFIEELNKNYGQEEISTDYYLYDDEKVKVFAKDLQEYDGTTLQYVGIMPKNDKLTDYVKNTTAKDVNNIITNLKELKIDNFEEGYATIISGNIPFFKYEYELQLMEDLQKMGIKDVFREDKSDLSKISAKEKTYISKAVHKANIEFSNEGIKASATTAMGGAGSASAGFNYLFEIPTKRINLTFDKPYMYIIRDKASGEVWFAGTVYEPVIG